MSGPDDEGAMDTFPEAGDVGVPPHGDFLPGDVEPVGEAVVWPDGALGDHRHPVGPAVQSLLHAMPANTYTLFLSFIIRKKMQATPWMIVILMENITTTPYIPMDCHVVR